MDNKKNFAHFISPMSWLLSCGAMILAIIVIFNPTLIKFFWAIIVVDSIALVIIGKLLVYLFYYFVPQSKLYFFGVDHEAFAQLNKENRIELLKSMMKFPSQYAAGMYFTSFIKAIPAYLMVVFYWDHDVSNLTQFTLVFVFTAVSYFYVYGCALFDAHAKINSWIEELHNKFNLTTEFEEIKIPFKKEYLHIQEILVQIFIILFVLTLQSIIIKTNISQSSNELIFKVTVIGLVGLALFTRIWYLGRQELLGGLTQIIHHMNSIDLNQNTIALPLHSSALLATFEKTFNLLQSRISSSERKLRNLVFQESDKSRYQALGEMSALIAHDLSAPLHAIQYCYNEIKEKKLNEDLIVYVNQMGLNIDQSIELISALRARLKNSTHSIDKSEFLEAHEFVVRLLETQFSPKLFEKIEISLDPKVTTLELAIPRVDLMHILDNLYRNSIKNLISKTYEKPILKIVLENIVDDFVHLSISDNGSGLSFEEFSLMTDENPIGDFNTGSGRSLGLRLTRRLVEQYGGSLSMILPQKVYTNNLGTNFLLRIKTYKKTVNPITN